MKKIQIRCEPEIIAEIVGDTPHVGDVLFINGKHLEVLEIVREYKSRIQAPIVRFEHHVTIWVEVVKGG